MNIVITTHAAERFVKRVHPCENPYTLIAELVPRSVQTREKGYRGATKRVLDNPKCAFVCKHEGRDLKVITVLGPGEVEALEDIDGQSIDELMDRVENAVTPTIPRHIKAVPKNFREVVALELNNRLGAILDRFLDEEMKRREKGDRKTAAILLEREKAESNRLRIVANLEFAKLAAENGRRREERINRRNDKRDKQLEIAFLHIAQRAKDDADAASVLRQIVDLDLSISGLLERNAAGDPSGTPPNTGKNT